MTADCLSTKISACCETLSSREAWVFAKKPALKAVLDAFQDTTRHSKDEVSVDVLLPLAAPMADNLLPSWHTETIQMTCTLLVMFVMTLGVSFRPFADQVVVPLLSAGRKIRRRSIEEQWADPSLSKSKLVDQMLWQSAETCLDAMSSMSRYDLVPMLEYSHACRQSVSVRCLVLRQVGIVLGSWTKPELEPYFDRLRDFLHDAMSDRNGCIRMAARAAFCNFCDVWSEHMDDLVHIPHRGNVFVAFHPRHAITTALTYGPTSVVQELGEEEDMVEDAVAGARADEALDVHLSVVIFFLVFLTSTLWSLPLLVDHFWWSKMGVSSKSQVTPIVVHVHDPLREGLQSEDQRCQDQRCQDQLRPAEHSDLDKGHSSDKASMYFA